MIVVAEFNEKTDLRETDQFGFVDLNEAVSTNKLPVSVPASEQSFDASGSSPLSPSQIGGIPADVFDAYEMRDSARAAVADANAKHEAAKAPASTSTE